MDPPPHEEEDVTQAELFHFITTVKHATNVCPIVQRHLGRLHANKMILPMEKVFDARTCIQSLMGLGLTDHQAFMLVDLGDATCYEDLLHKDQKEVMLPKHPEVDKILQSLAASTEEQ
jgi:hypothetical protein